MTTDRISEFSSVKGFKRLLDLFFLSRLPPFLSLNHVAFYFKPGFLIKSDFYVVPSPSNTLLGM